jgi:hypothetical protein
VNLTGKDKVPNVTFNVLKCIIANLWARVVGGKLSEEYRNELHLFWLN